MIVFIQLDTQIKILEYNQLIQKIPKNPKLKNISNLKEINHADLTSQIEKNPKALYIYLHNTKTKKSTLLLKYSIEKIAKQIFEYLFIEQEFDFQDVYNHYILKEFNALSPEIKKIVPTNMKNLKELLKFAQEYEMKLLEWILIGKIAKYVKNMFE
ncbi:unnamed protein product [marine sediment metagenome]|uniref:Uncharacterized protein n=1 Tax=marine sediment metagenome TaxID=412755 RepID=X1C5Q6_9ZZZZ